jgi:hypothetical protein
MPTKTVHVGPIPGFVISEVQYEPGAHQSKHRHEETRLIATIRGGFTECWGRGHYSCGPATVLLRPADELHSNRYDANGAFCINVRFGADSLPKLLGTAEDTLVALQRHAAYLRVQTLENTGDQTAKAAGEAVNAEKSVLDAAVRTRLQQVPSNRIAALGRYAFLAQQAQQDAAHAFSPDAQHSRGSVTEPIEASVAAAYNRLMETISNRGTASPDRETRRAAIASRDEVYDGAGAAAAAMFGGLVELGNGTRRRKGMRMPPIENTALCN